MSADWLHASALYQMKDTGYHWSIFLSVPHGKTVSLSVKWT